MKACRTQSMIPPGFSKPPPGFSSCMRTESVVSSGSGSYVKNSLPNNQYRMPSTGNLTNNSDDLIDPAIMAIGRRDSSSFDTRSTSFNEDAKLRLMMQQQSASAKNHHHQEPQSSFMQQHITPRFPTSQDDYYQFLTSRFVGPSYTHSQYKFTNGHIPNGAQQGLQEQIQRNGRLGYGDYMFQMPSSDNVYMRVFGM